MRIIMVLVMEELPSLMGLTTNYKGSKIYIRTCVILVLYNLSLPSKNMGEDQQCL